MWQEFYRKNADRDFVVLSVAIDVQGADAARPFVETAKATYPTLVDVEARLPALVGQKVVPLVYVVDEVGFLRFGGPGGPRSETLKRIEEVLAEPLAEGVRPSPSKPEQPEALPVGDIETVPGLLGRCRTLLARGDRAGALEALAKARDLDPENWLVRKQIWAIEHPEKFYEGKIDLEWQRRQMKPR